MFFKDFNSSLKAYSKGLKLMSELKLWRYILVPAIIGLLIGGGIILMAYSLSDNIGAYLSGFWPYEFGRTVVNFLSDAIGWVLVLAGGFIVFKHAVMAFSAPFMAPVSEKIEMHITGKELDITNSMSEFMAALKRGIRVNVRNLFMEILLTIPLLILGLIPVVNIVATVFIFYIQSYYAGFGNMDYTLERHKSYRESITFVKGAKGVAVGNGFVFMMMLLIPFVGIMLALPISTAAATISTVEKLNEKK